MYNRYIRNERGDYICIPVPSAPSRPPGPQEPPPPPPPPPEPPRNDFHHEPGREHEEHRDFPHEPWHEERREPPREPHHEHRPPPKPVPPPPDASQFLGQLLKRLRLDDVDTGDLLLLLILFFLFEEKADDEVLIALGLLLIL